MNSALLTQLNDLSGHWVDWVVDMSLQVTLLVAAVGGLTWLLRRRSATFLYVLWMLVLVRLMLPPSFALPTGWGWWLADAAPVEVPGDPVATRRMVTAPDGVTPGGPMSSKHPAHDGAQVVASWGMLLMIGWSGVVAALSAMLLSGCWRVRSWTRQAQDITDPALIELLVRCRAHLKITRAVRLKNSENCSTPLVVGWWKPVILLPAPVLVQLDERELETVLLHELNHLRRHDMLVNLLQGILTTLYFFHPLLWWANFQIRRLREEACDELTVQALDGKRKTYASALLKVTETLGYSGPAMALGAMEWKSSAARRLHRMLDRGEHFLTEALWWRALVTCVLAAVLLPAGARPGDRREIAARRAEASTSDVRSQFLSGTSEPAADASTIPAAVANGGAKVAENETSTNPTGIIAGASEARPAEGVPIDPPSSGSPFSVDLLRWLDQQGPMPGELESQDESDDWRPVRIYGP